MKVCIISYGIGNLGSLSSCLSRLGLQASIVSDSSQSRSFSHLILPGVGHFGAGADLLETTGWGEALVACRDRGAAVLGICLGMQLLAQGSDEAPYQQGLGLIAGSVKHLDRQGCTARIPHVGWNTVSPMAPCKLLPVTQGPQDFYFAHSFSLALPNQHVVATADHDVPVAAIVEHENVFGVQFHPEKSSSAGRLVLMNFMNYTPC
jgi:glutamine amidotransferase